MIIYILIVIIITTFIHMYLIMVKIDGYNGFSPTSLPCKHTLCIHQQINFNGQARNFIFHFPLNQPLTRAVRFARKALSTSLKRNINRNLNEVIYQRAAETNDGGQGVDGAASLCVFFRCCCYYYLFLRTLVAD